MAVPYVFAFQTLPIPLAQLDVNFNTPITFGATAVQLGDTVSSFAGLVAIGAVTGNFSGTVTANQFVGPVTGNVLGDVTGNLTGNVTGNVTGDLTGNADTATYATTAGSAGSVTNGVYTVGDQTINGIKTFVSLIGGSVSGNAATGTDGVYTSGTYSDPAWITALAGAKITGAINGVTVGLSVPSAAEFTYAHTGTAPATQSTSSITVDCALSNVFETTLTQSITTLTLSNPHDGQTINWFITQGGTGTNTMTWGSSVKFPGGASAGVLSTTLAAVDLVVLTYRASTGFWYGSVLQAFS